MQFGGGKGATGSLRWVAYRLPPAGPGYLILFVLALVAHASHDLCSLDDQLEVIR